MATNGTPISTPPLVSYKSYTTFLNELRENGVIPDRIDKTLMPRASGSQTSAMMAALKYLAHIDDAGKPSDSFKQLILATDEERKPMLAQLLKSRYGFLFNTSEFDLERATSGQMAEKFRELEIRGSTVTKTIAFFLALAKEAGVKVSAHIKPPPAPKGPNITKRAKRKEEDQGDVDSEDDTDFEDSGDVERFEIPIPGKNSVKVIVPRDLDADDWEMLQHMITAYIKRWKGFQSHAAKEHGGAKEEKS